MYDTSRIEAVAIAEILFPSFAITKQVLDRYSIPFHEGKPIISRIDTDSGDGCAIVYFNIENELFYLTVYIDTSPLVQIRSVEIEAGSKVYLWIEKPPNTAKMSLPFTPTRISTKGFEFGPWKDDPDSPNDKIKKLLALIYPEKERIKALAGETYICLNIAYYGYRGQMWGVHLDRDLITQLADLSIDLDLDLYARGDELA